MTRIRLAAQLKKWAYKKLVCMVRLRPPPSSQKPSNAQIFRTSGSMVSCSLCSKTPSLRNAPLKARSPSKMLCFIPQSAARGWIRSLLPGDTTAEQITPLLLDLCALALRLDKPLTARLMPVPGKRAGDATEFDFAFFANSKVMRLDSERLNLPLNDSASFSLHKKPSRP